LDLALGRERNQSCAFHQFIVLPLEAIIFSFEHFVAAIIPAWIILIGILPDLQIYCIRISLLSK
jgi:hypothetical protein